MKASCILRLLFALLLCASADRLNAQNCALAHLEFVSVTPTSCLVRITGCVGNLYFLYTSQNLDTNIWTPRLTLQMGANTTRIVDLGAFHAPPVFFSVRRGGNPPYSNIIGILEIGLGVGANAQAYPFIRESREVEDLFDQDFPLPEGACLEKERRAPNCYSHASWDSPSMELEPQERFGIHTPVASNLVMYGEVPRRPAIVRDPVRQFVPAGSGVGFEVLAIGAPPLTYQWYREGQLITNATLRTLHLANVMREDAGRYWAVVSNEFGWCESHAARLCVSTPPDLEHYYCAEDWGGIGGFGWIRFYHDQFCWNSESNLFYQVQCVPRLIGTNWANVGSPILGTGREICVPVVHPFGPNTRFYRVQIVP